MRMIDADKMLSGLKPVTYDMEHNAVTIADMSNIMRNWVCRQPTIPAAQWIRVEERLPGWSGDYICVSRDKNYVDDTYICSVCGYEFVITDGDLESNELNYCPRCGAKLDDQDINVPTTSGMEEDDG